MLASALLGSSWHSVSGLLVAPGLLIHSHSSASLIVSVNLCLIHFAPIIIPFTFIRQREWRRRSLEERELSSITHINGLEDVSRFRIAQPLEPTCFLCLDR